MPKTTSTSFYPNQDTFLIAVDCIIFGFRDNKISLLVQPRFLEPQKNGLSLLGGFVKADESVEQAASSVLSRLTGLENIFMEQVGMYGSRVWALGVRVKKSILTSIYDTRVPGHILYKNGLTYPDDGNISDKTWLKFI